MAKGTAICTCKKCGKTFEIAATKTSRKEADSFEAWATENIHECPECKKNREAAESAEKAAKYETPVITGASDKQIAYATMLRNKYIAANGDKMEKVTRLLASLIDDQLTKMAEAANKSKEEILKDAMEVRGLLKAYVIIKTSDAATLIEALKH